MHSNIQTFINNDLRKTASRKRALNLQRFFKTGEGQYGAGDLFLGLTVPDIRKVVLKYWQNISLPETKKLLGSKYHEERMCAILIIVKKFEKGDVELKKEIFDTYRKNTKYINNWDLIDLSAPKIVGKYLYDRKKDLLYKFAKSRDLWEKRIAIMATFYFINQNSFADTLRITEILLKDKHDLIHKAVGWMLREVGNRSRKIEENFLKIHYNNMPRTMLRYAIEKFPATRRKAYLLGKI